MSGDKKHLAPSTPSIREAAKAFLAQLDSLMISLERDTASFADPADHGRLRMVGEAQTFVLDIAGETQRAIDALRSAVAQPERSRPGALPDVDLAMGTIAAMKRGEPIEPEGIRSVVALAEAGYEQLEAFDIRWAADMRAIELWHAAHPGNELVWPDHADLVVWLMEVLDCSFDRPTVDEVDQVLGRLKGAMLRMPNALTNDALELIVTMAESMRKLARKAFLAEEDAREARRGVVMTIQPDLTDVRRIIGEVTSATEQGVFSSEIKAGHAVRADIEGQRYEGIAEEDGRATLKLVADPGAAGQAMRPGAPTRSRPQPVPGVYAEDQGSKPYDPDGGQIITAADHLADIPAGKNTLDYDRRQLEARINAKLTELGSDAEVDACVHDIAPGWTYAITPLADPPQITLVRYAPDEPL